MTEMRRWKRGMRNSAEQTIAQQQHGQDRILSDNMLLSGVLYRGKGISSNTLNTLDYTYAK